MRHDLVVEGLGFRLRPVTDADAALLLALRSDPELGRFLHPTPPALDSQLSWLSTYYERPGDYYFVVERRVDGHAEGVIALYDLGDVPSAAEWGRWILRRESLAAIESAALIYRCAFEHFGLGEVYCRTVAENVRVVGFHDSCNCAIRRVLPNHFILGDRVCDAIEHRVDRMNWRDTVGPHLERLSSGSLRGLHMPSLDDQQDLRVPFAFHHVGYACRSIAKARVPFEGLGYYQDGVSFTDPIQGVAGCFLVGAGPRIELLENLEGSNTLSPWLDAGISMYHLAYQVDLLAEGIAWARQRRGKLIVPPAPAVAFEGRPICFIMLPDRFLIEFIQTTV